MCKYFVSVAGGWLLVVRSLLLVGRILNHLKQPTDPWWPIITPPPRPCHKSWLRRSLPEIFQRFIPWRHPWEDCIFTYEATVKYCQPNRTHIQSSRGIVWVLVGGVSLTNFFQPSFLTPPFLLRGTKRVVEKKHTPPAKLSHIWKRKNMSSRMTWKVLYVNSIFLSSC